jgi:short-chain fatty acids transporter
MLGGQKSRGYGLEMRNAPALVIGSSVCASVPTWFSTSFPRLSGSIVLSQATPGSILNLVEKTTGHGLPLRETAFARFTVLPEVFLFIALPLLYRFLQPVPDQSTFADPDKLRAEDQARTLPEKRKTLGSALDNAWVLNVFLAGGGLCALAYLWRRRGFSLELDSVIMICLILGLLFHGRPIAYMNAVRNAARVTGPLILQYPLYGGIMGVMTATGLAGVLSKWFLAFSTTRSLPF